MNDYEWKVKIEDDLASMGSRIFIYRKTFNGPSVEIMRGDTTEIIDPAVQIKPSFVLPSDAMIALATALNNKGIKPKEISFVEGKLQATEYHLEDMRKLLKLLK